MKKEEINMEQTVIVLHLRPVENKDILDSLKTAHHELCRVLVSSSHINYIVNESSCVKKKKNIIIIVDIYTPL